MDTPADGLLVLYRSARLLPPAAFLDVLSRIVAGFAAASTDADLVAHLFEALRVNVRLSQHGVRGRTSEPASSAFALSGLDGRIRIETAGFSALLAAEWPRLPPGRLPDEIVGLEPDVALQRHAGRHVVVDVRSAGGVLLVGARPLTALDRLPVRRRAVARLYADGWTPAAVAEQLGLSPSAVGNQIAAAYRTLGVSRRSELAALARGRPG